jgi:putative endonuclease
VTNNLVKRIETHNLGKGAKYTAVRLPIQLRWQKECATRSDALKEEAAIKALTRTQKQAIIMGQ